MEEKSLRTLRLAAVLLKLVGSISVRYEYNFAITWPSSYGARVHTHTHTHTHTHHIHTSISQSLAAPYVERLIMLVNITSLYCKKAVLEDLNLYRRLLYGSLFKHCHS